MPITKLMQTLAENHIRYETIVHSPAFTAQNVAAMAHIPGYEMAKTVVVKLDGTLAMVVLPAPRKINFNLVKQATGAQHAELAEEREFLDKFPACEVGAMPPFGNLYDMEVFVDEKLAEDEEIAFNAGSHTECIRMRYEDFDRLVHPKVCCLSN